MKYLGRNPELPLLGVEDGDEKDMRMLVAGTDFIGSHLVNKLVRRRE